MEAELKNIYNELCKRLEGLAFSEYWPGFKRYPFALYTAQSVLVEGKLVPWDQRFMGNTAIPYENTYLAIWDIEQEWRQGEIDLDRLASNLVHEMFHAYQRESGDTRNPNDLELLQYPLDAGNFAGRYEENRRIAAAVLAKEKSDKQKYLAEICCLRKMREDRIGGIIQEEALVETVEGMAEYVGLLALRQISAAKFGDVREGYLRHLMSPSEGHFPVRLSSYYSGSLFLMASQEAGLSVYHSIGEEKRTVLQLMEEQLDLPEKVVFRPNKEIMGRAERWILARREEVRQAQEQLTQWVGGPFRITGFDPMNMVRVGDIIYCKSFVSLQEKEARTMRVLQGKTILEMKKGHSQEVIRYSCLR